MDLIILGVGGFGKTIADVAEQINTFSTIRFLDDHATGEYILGKCEDYRRFKGENVCFYPAIGENGLRLSWLDRLAEEDCRIASIVHPSAYVSPRATLEVGTAILPGAMVNTGTRLGRGVLVNMGAMIDHGCILEEGVHICLGAIVKAENRIPALVKIEAGQIIEARSLPL